MKLTYQLIIRGRTTGIHMTGRKTFCPYLLILYFLLTLSATTVKANDYATLVGNVKNLEEQPLVIYLEPLSKNQIITAPENKPSTIDSNGYKFEPAFQVVQKGSVLEIKNNDMVLHNTHISENRITLFNVATPLRTHTVKKTMQRTGFYNVTCDIHPSMKANLAVITSPYYSVLWEPGRFQIKNIIPGQYHLHFLQPEKDEIITLLKLEANGEKHISF